jgi:hypothetical protein
MAFSVNQLKGVIGNRGGAAQGNRFRVQVMSPALGWDEDLSLLCKSVTMPGKQILSVDRQVGASFQKIAYGYASEDVTLSFLLTNDYSAKDFFEEWQQRAVNMDEQFDTHRPRFKNEYSFDTHITAIDKAGNDVYRVVLVKAYPTTVNAIEYSDENDGVIQLSVQLSYRRWYKEQL